MEPIFFKALMLSMSPFMFTILVILFWKGMEKFQNQNNSEKIAMTLIITYNYLQPAIIMSMSRIANCKEIEQGKFYLNSELSVECYTNMHYQYMYGLVMPNLALWLAVYPVATFFKLLRNRNHLADSKFLMKYGFFYNGYKEKYFFWEFVVMNRKIMIIFISIYFQSNPATKALIVLLILGFSIYLQRTRQPFITNELNELELRSIIVSLSTIYFALFHYLTDAILARVLMMLIIISTNIYFLYYMLLKMLTSQIGLVKQCLNVCPPIKNILEKALKEYEIIDKSKGGRALSELTKSFLSLKNALNASPRASYKLKARESAKKSSNNFMIPEGDLEEK